MASLRIVLYLDYEYSFNKADYQTISTHLIISSYLAFCQVNQIGHTLLLSEE